MTSAYFSDAEVDDMTAGLSQDAAKIRYLRRLGLRVDRKPNGRPLAWRPQSHPESMAPAPADAGIVTDLQGWAARRKGQHGQKAQGR